MALMGRDGMIVVVNQILTTCLSDLITMSLIAIQEKLMLNKSTPNEETRKCNSLSRNFFYIFVFLI